MLDTIIVIIVLAVALLWAIGAVRKTLKGKPPGCDCDDSCQAVDGCQLVKIKQMQREKKESESRQSPL
jgi:hypothetical protein